MSGQGSCSVRPHFVLKVEDISYDVVFLGTHRATCNNAGGGGGGQAVRCDNPGMESLMAFLWSKKGLWIPWL
jgi:hypothetical protein